MKNRDYYLEQLKHTRDNGFIKKILGARRCGKSTLLNMFQSYLVEKNFADSEHIFALNFQSFLFDELKVGKILHEYVGNKIK